MKVKFVMTKFDKIFVKVVSYIGMFGMGMCFACGLDYCFDKWVCGGLILSAILLSCGFIGGEECIPEDEREGE